MKIDLYTPTGWINVPAIAARPTWLKVIIGARQVGKTYGTLKYMLDNDRQFILMRRTTEELKFIASNGELDPFTKFAPEYHTMIKGAGGSYSICDYDDDGIIPGSQRGVALSLPIVSHIRGFDGSRFTDIVFDEFIPEKGVIVRKTEGDSLLNAYTTISGNRELEGCPPLTLWLLANTNNINSPILDALGLTDDIIKMRSRGREYIEHDGISIFQGRSQAITDARRQTVLARRVDPDSSFAQMAYNNEWAYDDSPVIKARSLRGLTPLCSFGKDMFYWEDSASIYCCSSPHKVEHYNDNDFEREQFVANYRWLLPWYVEKMVTFSDIKLLARFKRLFGIDY